MLRILVPVLLALAAGGVIGHYAVPPKPLPPKIIKVKVKVKAKANPTETVFLKWKMASNYPPALTQFGALGKRFAAKLKRVSGGAVEIKVLPPGVATPPAKCIEAIGARKVQACWSTPAHWYRLDSALALFTGAPFGPSAREFAAWIYYGGGGELMDGIYAKYGVKSIVCGVTAPEAGGWYKKEIASADDFKGLKVRFFGLGARVMEKLGVDTQRIKGADLIAALKDGRLDGTEYSMPAIDVGLGLHKHAKYYYFPGWQQQSTLLEVLISRKAWSDLPDKYRAMIEQACGDNFREGLAHGEAIQASALRELIAKGVEIRRWPAGVLEALRKAWADVVVEESAANPTFKRVWQSYSTFRREYATWKRLGHMDNVAPAPQQ